MPNGVSRITWITLGSLEVAEGQSYEMKIGGSGRPVIGRIVIPPNVPWMERRAEIERKGAVGGKLTELGVEVGAGGRFRAENIEAGDYRLRIMIHHRRGRIISAGGD